MQIKNKWLSKISGLLKDSPKAKTDLLDVLKSAVHNGLLDNESLKMIEGVFKVSEVQVRDIMIPRPHMIVIAISRHNSKCCFWSSPTGTWVAS